MTRQTSFAHQKVVLEQLSRHLTEFGKALENLAAKYEQTVSSLYEHEGLMEEIFSDYKAVYMDPMKESILNLSEKIITEDIAFVEKEIDFISSR